jgi:hypothetical protein
MAHVLAAQVSANQVMIPVATADPAGAADESRDHSLAAA